MRLPFNLAFIATLFVTDAAYLHHNLFLSHSEKICALSLITCCAVLATIANYRIELADRLAYVLFLREELRTKELSRLNDNLHALSFRDGLTGLANRRHFDACLEAAWQQAALNRSPISLVMTDVDHFKHLNDTHGHIAGDQVLIQLAGILQSTHRREHDIIARFGGEEFVLLLPSYNAREALQAAEHVRSTLSSIPLEVDSVARPIAISVSCGVATLHPDHTLDATELIALADQALYRAKRSGRDRVCT
jgi:diguanylate cyclase (GGDEF)-like protein